jgi:hypothetical protein
VKQAFAFIVKSLLAHEFSVWLACLFLRLRFPYKYKRLLSAKICIYSSCYGGYDQFCSPCPQSIPADIFFFGDAYPASYSSDLNVRIYESAFVDPRCAAKYFKLCPHEVPDLANYSISVWIDASCRIHSKYFLELLLMSTYGPISMRRHPDRSSILSEAFYSKDMAKYSSVDLVSHARAYISNGVNDDHLWHCALIVRFSSPSVVDFNTAWWIEMDKSLQDQISAPYAEYVSAVKIQPIPKSLNWFNIFSFDTAHRNYEYGKSGLA